MTKAIQSHAGDETEEELQITSNHETRADDEKHNDEGNNEEIQLITDEEIQAAINNLKKGKASDNNGIRAEDIKTCFNVTKETIKQIFNEVLKQESCTPETWRGIRIKVIYKKGNEEDVGNYRPICTLPALYKLFSTVLHNRLYARLQQNQSEDQGWFQRTDQNVDCDD